MRKSSRFWWLHGAILLSAAIGCNRNYTNGGGSCAPGAMGGAPPYGGTASTGGPIGSGAASLYSQSPPLSGASPMPSGSAFSSGMTPGYPNMSSQMPPQAPMGLGGTR